MLIKTNSRQFKHTGGASPRTVQKKQEDLKESHKYAQALSSLTQIMVYTCLSILIFHHIIWLLSVLVRFGEHTF